MNIYALSSGRGPSGIAIVRVSGKETLQVCKNLTKLKEINSNEVNYCKFYDPKSDQSHRSRGSIIVVSRA
jgi:tRNA U34 5-carboxymethylaminomethyl modifying GTPase MnmE/TrmE